MSTPPFPPRLHIILAREASTAIVIRRGPSKWVSTFKWDRKLDTVRLGQWLHGRIYERRCDLSPDGNHFIYMAMNGRWESESKGSWNAISKAPYLKAIGFWPKGDCWFGGGLFIDNTKFWLNDGYGNVGRPGPAGLKEVFEPPFEHVFGGECPGVYYPRLMRDGWKLIENDEKDRRHDATIFEKPLDHGWVLRKIANATINAPEGKGCYHDEHTLRHAVTKKVIDGETWEWCDWDPIQERLVWTTGGCLYGARLEEAGLVEERLIHDFNPYKFEEVVAPY